MPKPYKPKTDIEELESMIIDAYMSQGMTREQAEYKLNNPSFIIRMSSVALIFAFVFGYFYSVY